MPDRPLHPVRRAHLDAIGGPLGIWQHAARTRPDRAHGYCTDDVARELSVHLLHRHAVGWAAVRPAARRSLDYLAAAWDPGTGEFRNFRAADGAWLDGRPSQDSQGRAMLALGVAARDAPDAATRVEAATLFAGALPGTRRLTALRAIASTILGCDAALAAGLGGETDRVIARLAGALHRAFPRADRRTPWPWPEPVLTYENALLPHALIVAGRRLADPRLARTGLRSLDWLIDVQTSPGGWFSPIGNDGWWPRAGARSRFDQQPIEAAATVLAASAALAATGEQRYERAAESAYAWFLGDNDVGVAVADVVTGGCHDGLTPAGVNLNQGAESTLMWLTALEAIRSTRSSPVDGAAVSAAAGVAAPAPAVPPRPAGLRP